MKIKWIVVAKIKRSGRYCCWNDLYDSKEQALQHIKEHREISPLTLDNIYVWKKIKIFPIRWDSIENRKGELP